MDILDKLPPHLRETAELMAQGLCNKEIAVRRGVTVQVAKNYASAIYARSGMTKLQLAVMMASKPRAS